jgi:hypothetical protein
MYRTGMGDGRGAGSRHQLDCAGDAPCQQVLPLFTYRRHPKGTVPNVGVWRRVLPVSRGLAADPARMDVTGRGLCQHGRASVRAESFIAHCSMCRLRLEAQLKVRRVIVVQESTTQACCPNGITPPTKCASGPGASCRSAGALDVSLRGRNSPALR